MHKTANVLNKVPLSVQAGMKTDLREIFSAPNRASAETAIAVFVEKYDAKYAKAVDCLTKDHSALLAFYDFPAEHWDHLRTSNSDPERLCHRSPSHGAHERLPVIEDRQADGLQTGHGRSQADGHD